MPRFRDDQRMIRRIEKYGTYKYGHLNDSSGFISIQADIDDALAFFDGLEVNQKQIQKRLLRTTGIGASKYAKKNFNALKSRTGKLKKSITYRLGKDGNYVVVTNTAESDNATARREITKRGKLGAARKARYGFMLAHGFTNVSKSENRPMRFLASDGRWVSVYRYAVRARNWIEPPVDKYVNSYDLQLRLDAELQRQIDYWEKRLTKA